MRINIYYGGRGIMGDPTLFVIAKLQEILEELHVKVKRYNLYEEKGKLASMPNTLKEADGIVLASTVEWFGTGGYMQQFLDACWLYGNKERIHDIYMCPVVMATTNGEKEGRYNLEKAWEILGGRLCEGISGYVEDTTAFELNVNYALYIEKKAENLYRTISQKINMLPSSNTMFTIGLGAQTPLPLTPQETEQLSKYVSDDEYVKTQKEDIKELASMFKTKLENKGNGSQDRLIKLFKDSFKEKNGFETSVRIEIEGQDNPLIMRIKNDTFAIEYGNIEKPAINCRGERKVIEEIALGSQTFQKAFMENSLTVKGNFQQFRALDEIFNPVR